MTESKQKNLTLRYGATQFTYWAASTGATSFATTYLLSKGLPSGTVGALLAAAGLLACVTQPLLAAAADLGVAERHHVLVVDVDLAGGRALEQVEAAYQGALARARQADDAKNIARPHVQRHIAQRLEVFLSVGEHLLNML